MKALSYEVGYMLGIPIDYYASVNMPGFIEVVEQVGSVTVNNTRNIHDTTLEFDLAPGVHTLGPEDALRYVRSRHGSGGDFGRNERQQQVLTALRKEMLKPQNLTKLPDIIEALSQVITTDFPLTRSTSFLLCLTLWKRSPAGAGSSRLPSGLHTCRETRPAAVQLPSRAWTRSPNCRSRVFGDKSLWNGRPVPPPPNSPSPSKAISPRDFARSRITIACSHAIARLPRLRVVDDADRSQQRHTFVMRLCAYACR